MAFRTTLLATLSFASVIGGIIRSPSNDITHVVHEKREKISERWVKRDRIAPSSWLPMRIGLVENMDNAEQHLLDISDPGSPNFGKHWSMEDTIEFFKPTDEAIEAVHLWLVDAGISPERITHADNKGWFAFHATGEEAENLLHAEFHEFEDTVTGGIRPACDVYHVPLHIQHYIDFITPGTLLVAPKGIDGKRNAKRSSLDSRSNLRLPSFLTRQPVLPFSKLIHNLEHCDLAITPVCIAALYDIPPADFFQKPNPDNALALFEGFSFYAQKDLDLFFRNFTPYIPQGTHPSLDFNAPRPTKNISQAGGEVDLDLELAYPIVYPQKINIFGGRGIIVEPPSYEWSFNTFFDTITGSHCTSDGPKGKLKCGTKKLENVVSTSYGGQEADQTFKYEQRLCKAFLKYGLQGVTFIFSSGDAGVGGYPKPYGFDNPKTGCIGPKGNIFNPTEPSCCPYVTAVGATKVYPGSSVFQPHPESAVFDPVGHPYQVNYSSGGGFSNYHGIPSYQKLAVQNYFANHNPPYPSYKKLAKSKEEIRHFFNETGGIYNKIGRGIPDVAANGDNIAIYNKGKFTLSGGTSASAPIFASIINRIVEERLRIGKGPLGFINPTLYAHPYVLNDITNGTNPGCFTNGFKAVPGWDPVTGLGTPNYPKMLALFLSLP